MSSPIVRLRPTAAIIRDQQILLVEYDEPGFGVHYSLPDGGLQPAESLHGGLRREVREETCAEIEVGPLLMVWEITPGAQHGPYHHIGMVFRCQLAENSQPRTPQVLDQFQVGVRWIALSNLASVNLLPRVGIRLLEVVASSNGVDPYYGVQ